jgi:hypothetical protein
VSGIDLAEDDAKRKFRQALSLLEEVAADLRGPNIPAHPAAMATEIAVSNAIDSLRATGFKVR